MDKKLTRPSFLNLANNSFFELFHPKSDKSLFDYDQLKFVDLKELNLLDFKQLNLINVAVLLGFFEYVGALYLTLFISFGISWGAYSIYTSPQAKDLAFRLEKINAGLNLGYGYSVAQSALDRTSGKYKVSNLSGKEVPSAKPAPRFAYLVQSDEVLTSKPKLAKSVVMANEPSVMGISTVETCSFSVNSKLYSDKSVLRVSEIEDSFICSHSSGSSASSVSWLESNKVDEEGSYSEVKSSAVDSRGCISSDYILSERPKVVRNVIYNEAKTPIGTCELTVSYQENRSYSYNGDF